MGTTTLKHTGGDYTSVSAWQADHGGLADKGLVAATEGVTLQCFKGDYSGVGGGTNFIKENIALTGWTCDATYFVRIECPDAEMHDGTPETGFHWKNNGDGNALNISGATFTQLHGLEMVFDGTVNYRYALTWSSQNGIANRCIFNATSTASGAKVVNCGNRDGVYRNCLFIGDATNVITAAHVPVNTDPNFHNCTFADVTTQGVNNLNSGAYEVAIVNCVDFNCGAFYNSGFAGTWNSSCGYNASETQSTLDPPDEVGTSNYSSNVVTGDFEGTGTGDFHLASGSSLIGIANDLSGTFTDDIDGDTRSAWDIGMDEYVSAATSPKTLTLLGVG